MSAMNEIDVRDWDDFEQQIKELRMQYATRPLLFRGVGDSKWPLTTTLERYDDSEMSFARYYRAIATSEAHVASFVTSTWESIDIYPGIEELASQYDAFDLHLWGGKLKALGYMAFLRHHGFPSPLLDWTRSPYFAAFFAFRSPTQPPPTSVSVFCFCERPTGTKGWSSDKSRIFHMGPHVRTARRHHLQQGEYTMCLRWELNSGWSFVLHETVFSRNEPTQDLLWRFNIPWTERAKVLKILDDHNVNAFSLFESDEALLETIALRRLVLEPAMLRLGAPPTEA